MSYFVPVEGRVGTQPIADTSTVANHPVGTRLKAVDRAGTNYGEGEFVYLAGVASTALGSVVNYNTDDGTSVLAAANGIGPVAVAMSANIGSQYGWYQIFGKGVAKVLTGFLDNANCYLTATAGSIDDAVVAGDYIRGMKGASAIGTPAAGLAEVEMNYPQVSDGLEV